MICLSCLTHTCSAKYSLVSWSASIQAGSICMETISLLKTLSTRIFAVLSKCSILACYKKNSEAHNLWMYMIKFVSFLKSLSFVFYQSLFYVPCSQLIPFQPARHPEESHVPLTLLQPEHLSLQLFSQLCPKNP